MALAEPVTAVTPPDSPYLGHKSYQVQDKAFFFGRDDDAAELVAQVIATPYTLLHARSGTGKTSLLNARLIPELEKRGWTPVRVEPLADPISSIFTAVQEVLLVPPATEALALDRAMNALELSGDDTLDTLIATYDREEKKDPRATRPLIAPVSRAEAGLKEGGSVTPYLCRLLRSSLEVQRFGAHLVFCGGFLIPGMDQLNGGIRLGWLADALRSSELQAAAEQVRGRLSVTGRNLGAFLRNVFHVWADTHPDGAELGLVLVLDQFEEVFTRFVGESSATRPARENERSWKLRRELFDQLAALYTHPPRPPRSTEASPSLPLRLVISMRSEYVGQLDEIAGLSREMQRSQFRLRLLDRRQALQAVTRPAGFFDYGYTFRCLATILGALSIERTSFEPSHIQIVCGKLFDLHGAAKAAQERARDRLIRADDIPEGGPVKMLEGTVREALDELDDPGRAAVLDLLAALLTTEHTRNVVPRIHLLKAPFRNEARRAELLVWLGRHNLVREEFARGTHFVEITHEFLIPPLLEALSADAGYVQLREALHSLKRFGDRDFRRNLGDVLQQSELQRLHAQAANIDWPDWAKELMLRSLIYQVPQSPILGEWAAAVDGIPDLELPNGDEPLPAELERRRMLALYQLRELGKPWEMPHAVLDEGEDVSSRSLTIAELILASWLKKAAPVDAAMIERWTKKVANV